MEITRDPVHLKGTPPSSPQELRAGKGEIVTERLDTVRLVDPAVLVFREKEEHSFTYRSGGVIRLVRRSHPHLTSLTTDQREERVRVRVRER